MFDCFNSVYKSQQDMNKKPLQCISLNIGLVFFLLLYVFVKMLYQVLHVLNP